MRVEDVASKTEVQAKNVKAKGVPPGNWALCLILCYICQIMLEWVMHRVMHIYHNASCKGTCVPCWVHLCIGLKIIVTVLNFLIWIQFGMVKNLHPQFSMTSCARVPLITWWNSDRVDQIVVLKSGGFYEILIKELYVAPLADHLGAQNLTHALFQRV